MFLNKKGKNSKKLGIRISDDTEGVIKELKSAPRELSESERSWANENSLRNAARELSRSGPSRFKMFGGRPAQRLKFAEPRQTQLLNANAAPPKPPSHFTSPTLTVLVGPMSTAFYLHKKRLADRSPYFAGLLSFSGSESKTNTVSLNDPVDNLDVFQMFVDYLYHESYTTPGGLRVGVLCILHALVYVLAERLLMEPLKTMALGKMVQELAGACRVGSGRSWEVLDETLDVDTVVEIVEIVYENTEDTYPEDEDNKKNEERSEVGSDADASLLSKGRRRNLLEEEPPRREEELVATDVAEAVLGDVLPQEVGETLVLECVVSDTEYAEVEAAISEMRYIDDAAGDPLPSRDRMRKLVSRYAASQLAMLSRKAKFRKLVRSCGEFAEDLITAA